MFAPIDSYPSFATVKVKGRTPEVKFRSEAQSFERRDVI